MTILVTGATGLVGVHLVRLLCERGHRPRLLRRPQARRELLRELAYEEVVGDVTDGLVVAEALQGVRHVFHCAGVSHLTPSWRGELQRVNVEGTRTVVEAARRAGVQRLVLLSCATALGAGPLSAPATEEGPYTLPGDNPHPQSRRQAEQLALAAATPSFQVLVGNATLPVGPWDGRPGLSGALLLAVARGQVHAYPTGGFNLVNARDVAEGLLAILERGTPGERYILGGENLTWRAFLTLVAQEAGVRPPRVPLPEGLVRAGGRLGDALGWVLGRRLRPVDSATLRPLWLTAYSSSQKAQRTLGYAPRPVRWGVREALRWFQEQGELPRERPLAPRGPLLPHQLEGSEVEGF